MQTNVPIQTTPANMVEFMVVVDKPVPTEVAGQNGGETYAELVAHTARHRAAIAAWLEEQGNLSSEVAQLLDPTGFPVLFVICTPRAAKQLEQAPGVVGVARSPQLGF